MVILPGGSGGGEGGGGGSSRATELPMVLKDLDEHH